MCCPSKSTFIRPLPVALFVPGDNSIVHIFGESIHYVSCCVFWYKVTKEWPKKLNWQVNVYPAKCKLSDRTLIQFYVNVERDLNCKRGIF